MSGLNNEVYMLYNILYRRKRVKDETTQLSMVTVRINLMDDTAVLLSPDPVSANDISLVMSARLIEIATNKPGKAYKLLPYDSRYRVAPQLLPLMSDTPNGFAGVLSDTVKYYAITPSGGIPYVIRWNGEGTVVTPKGFPQDSKEEEEEFDKICEIVNASAAPLKEFISGKNK